MRKVNRVQQAIFCLGMFLLPAPVFLLAGAGAGAGEKMLLPLLAALLLGIAVLRLKKGFRLPCVALSMALCFFFALRLGRQGQDNGAWPWACAVFSALAAAAYPYFLGGVLEGGSMPVLWFSGFPVIAFSWAAGMLLNVPRTGEMMSGLLWVYSVFLFFALTMESMKEAVGAGHAPSWVMLFRNLGAALGWAGLFLLLTHLPAIAAAVRAVWGAIREAAAFLMSLLARLAPSGQGGGMGGGGGMMEMPPAEAAEPSAFAVILEQIFRVICLILAAAALLALLYLIFKALRRGFRLLAARFRLYMNTVQAGYDDHVESLLDWGEIRRSVNLKRKRRRERAQKVPWDKLSPRQQVRRSFQSYLAHHPEIPASRTARQVLEDPRHADIYDAARYSTREITGEEAASVLEIRDK